MHRLQRQFPFTKERLNEVYRAVSGSGSKVYKITMTLDESFQVFVLSFAHLLNRYSAYPSDRGNVIS